MFRYIEISKISKFRYIEISKISKFRHIEISNVFGPSSPGTPVFYMQILNDTFHVSNIEIVSISVFDHRSTIELDPDIDIQP